MPIDQILMRSPWYAAAILNHKKEVAPFPVASYYFLCDKYSTNAVRRCFDFGTGIFNNLGDRLTSYWEEKGSPSLPPDDGGAHATNEWNGLLGKEPLPPPPPEIPNNEEQPMPPYDPSAPDQMFHPGGVSGDDVLSKSYLWLDWMEKNPSNTNGAEGFLLYTNSLAAAGYFGGPEGNALSDGLLSIQNSEGKTLVAECVDITMEQMILTGGYSGSS